MNARSRPAARRLLTIAAAALAAAACNLADDAGREKAAKAAPAAANAALPSAKSERQPARAQLGEPEAGSAAEPEPAREPAGITRAWFAGRWTDSGDCAEAGRFEPNGTYLLADGTRGMWNIVEGRLVVQHKDGRSSLPIRRIDADTVEVANPEGAPGRSRRCR
jgi:hypothetical protein